jgi:hypothetical protein
MINEKEKVKGNEKRGCFGWQIISLSALSTVIIIVGFFFFAMPTCGCEDVMPQTETAIVKTNEAALTQISATATAEAEQGR